MIKRILRRATGRGKTSKRAVKRKITVASKKCTFC